MACRTVRRILLASIAVAAGLGPVSVGTAVAETVVAENVVKGPGDLSINCDDFRLYPNGTIEANKDATLVYPDKKGSFAEATFGPHVYSSSGIDLGEWVNKSCRK